MAKREELLGPVVGPQGPKEDKGDCLFSLELDANGNLYAIYQDGSAVPNLEFEAATGNLYLVVDE